MQLLCLLLRKDRITSGLRASDLSLAAYCFYWQILPEETKVPASINPKILLLFLP